QRGSAGRARTPVLPHPGGADRPAAAAAYPDRRNRVVIGRGMSPHSGGDLATICRMAVRPSREVIFDAPKAAILDALADIESVPTWSPMHKSAEVLDRYPDGRPHH